MNFSDLQQSWQQQAAPAAGQTSEAAPLLAETERLHRFGRRRNRLSTGLTALALACFLVGQLLRATLPTPLQWLGLALVAATLLGFLAAMWWGTALREAAQPGLDSRAYLGAALRAFRFRRTVLLWLSIPYALGFGASLLLWTLPRLAITGLAGWWKVALALALLVSAALLGRRVGLRKYEAQFGTTERALAYWQQKLLAES